MSTNPLNDISKVYLEQIAVDEAKQPFPAKKVERQMEKARKGSVYGKPFSNEPAPKTTDAEKKETRRYSKMFHASEKAKREKQEADKARRSPTFYKDTHPASAPKMAKAQREEFEIDETSHLETDMKKRAEANEKARQEIMKTKAHKDMAAVARKKFDEGVDQDKDGDNDFADVMIARMKASGKKTTKQAIAATTNKPYNKKPTKKVAEGYSNWREDLFELISTDYNQKIKEKPVHNKVKTSASGKISMSEAVEEMGGTLLEMVEIDEFDFILESAYDELLDEGYEDDDIEEALEYALTEAKVTFGHDTPAEKKRSGLLAAARQKLSGAKTAAKAAVARGARGVAKGALGVARKMEGGKKPHTPERKPSTYRGAGAGTKERVSSGSYTPPTKKKAEPVSDPWEGSYKKSSEVKAKTKKVAAPKRKRKSKLDDLIASVRSEETSVERLDRISKERVAQRTSAAKAERERKSASASEFASFKKQHIAGGGTPVSALDAWQKKKMAKEEIQIDEKTLTAAEMKKREEIVRSMKTKAADFEKRYPGRGEEVMFATATTMAKKMAEDIAIGGPSLTPTPTSSGVSQQAAQQAAKLSAQQKRMQQQKKQQELLILQKKMQALRSTQGIDPGITV